MSSRAHDKSIDANACSAAIPCLLFDFNADCNSSTVGLERFNKKTTENNSKERGRGAWWELRNDLE